MVYSHNRFTNLGQQIGGYIVQKMYSPKVTKMVAKETRVNKMRNARLRTLAASLQSLGTLRDGASSGVLLELDDPTFATSGLISSNKLPRRTTPFFFSFFEDDEDGT